MGGIMTEEQQTFHVTRRQLVVGGAATAAGIALAACGSSSSSSTTTAAGGTTTTAAMGATTTAPTATTMAVKKGGSLKVGIVGTTKDIVDGQYIVSKPDQARLVMGWEPLVNYDDNFNVSYDHGLAEEVEVKSADLYVVRLKKDITFHNGKPVTADDVIYSFQRRLDTTLGLAPALATLLDPTGLTKEIGRAHV